MEHCTPEQLALTALNEPTPGDDAAHLAGCAECLDEVAALQLSVDLLAVPEFAAPTGAVAPPPAVWASIAAATGVGVSPASSARPAEVPLHPVPPPAPALALAPAPNPALPDNVVPLRRPRRTWLLVAAAAVVGGVVGAGVVNALDRPEASTAVAVAVLDPLADADASGDARVVERPDGSRVLQVQLSAPALDDGYYEVWLLRPDVSGLVSVGVVQAGTTVFDLPAGIDLGEYPVVDISVERLDGDPSHSGDSVARGELDA